MKSRVAVIGQGYVGLPMAITVAEAGFRTLGIDIDLDKVRKLAEGISNIEDISSERVKKQLKIRRYSVTNDFSLIRDCQIVLICVPTPLDSQQRPDLSHIFVSTIEISRYLAPGTLVILESTVAPGTTREVVIPSLLKNSNLTIDQIDVAYSPERVDPSNTSWNLTNTPKIVAGFSERSKIRAHEFYSTFVKEVFDCETLEIAETAKLLENSFRLVNISFVNELSMFCRKAGIDVSQVISAASTKPYGFMPFFPSLGVGGHCIPVDPIYLSKKALEVNSQISLIDLSLKINDNLPNFFINQAEHILGSLENKKILVLGIAYKPNISDTRETPAAPLILGLRKKKAQVLWHDEIVKVWKNEKSTPLNSNFDLAIIATLHDYFDLAKLGAVPVINTRESIY